jgi:hypothetical protein
MFVRAFLALAVAATVIPQSVEQLTDKSTEVVRAKVVRQVAAREPGPAGIYTRTTLKILEVLKGPASGELVVRQAGGTLGTESVELVGDAEFRDGEQVLAFLDCRRGDHCTLIGLSQGKFHLEASAKGELQASRDFSKTDFLGPPLSGASQPYAAIASRVRARAQGGR